MTRHRLTGVKIGVSANPRKRVEDGSTWVPEGLRLVAYWWCSDREEVESVESAAHELAKRHRMTSFDGKGAREWFAIAAHDARGYVQQAANEVGVTISEQRMTYLRDGLTMSYYRWRWALMVMTGLFVGWMVVWFAVVTSMIECQDGLACDLAVAFNDLFIDRLRSTSPGFAVSEPR